MIDWTSTENIIRLNPRLPSTEKAKIEPLLQHVAAFKGHVWLASSGTTGQFKLVGLDKNALLASAQAVNTHLQSPSQDIWLNPLPDFHVGGLGVWARAYLSGAQVIPLESSWDPKAFHDISAAKGATLSALVPTQVFDLVTKKLRAPASFRAIIVGGGALSDSLYTEAKALGWPILPSYGMTECGSQIATAAINHGNSLQILPHLQVKIDEESRICVKGSSLFTAYLNEQGIIDPKVDGWYTTSDLGVVQGNTLQMRGRVDDFIKISGELVSMARLEAILNNIKLKCPTESDLALIAMPDQRLGFAIHLAVTKHESHEKKIIEEYQKQVLPFEAIRQIHIVDEIPRSALNKVMRDSLIRKIMTLC